MIIITISLDVVRINLVHTNKALSSVPSTSIFSLHYYYWLYLVCVEKKQLITKASGILLKTDGEMRLT